MKILYGIQGTGNGHISRARVMAKELAKYSEISVTYLFSGRAKTDFFDMEIFGDFLHYDGLTFISKNGKIDLLATAKKNNLWQCYQHIKTLDLSPYDLIITDFEPITAWAAKLAKKNVLGIGHQYAFGKNTPLTGDNFFTRWIMRNFAPAKHSFGLHWANYASNVLPPIIDTSMGAAKNMGSAKKADHVLVYLPFENQTQITALLQNMPEVNFIQYSPELHDATEGNVTTCKTNYLGFKSDLLAASGVITNCGFELISECLHLGLPILTKALNGQMEQESNALALQQLEYATVVKTLTLATINNWYHNKSEISPKPIPDVAAAIANSIANNQWQNTTNLNTLLWREYLKN